ncbi:MAG: cation-transporting P-type ATPase [Bacteroidales bacterium]|nr:cation-transporting P-type ATPase [Bacteroidales bacterium]
MSDSREKKEVKKWYAIEADEVLKEFSADAEKGLESGEVKKRLEEYGRNELPKGKKRQWWMRLLLQFHNTLIYVLIAAAVITALLNHWIDTWVILAVIIINALIGFIQEGKAEQALESIREMLSLEAVVIRDGKKQTVDAEELVPGDIVMLKSGDKIPADLRLVKSKDLRVEESPLTGESTAVDKVIEPVEEGSIVGDQISMAFSGTVVTYGKATGVVVATGSDTELGKINQMISEVEKITTPLLQQIEKFGKWLSLIILVITAGFFAFGYFFRDYSLDELFLAAIGLVVASIPEGLPAIMTITLAIGVQRMAARNAIVRRLPSVETLGAVNVICSDKTGTLTRNEMTAKTIITAKKDYQVEGTGYAPEGKILHDDKEVEPEDDKVLMQLLRATRVCNNAEIGKEEGKWKLTGAPTEGALLALSYKGGLKDFKPERIDSIPFESDHKYMATLNEIDNEKFVFMSGAPERVMEFCSQQYTSEGGEDIDPEFWEKKIEEVAAKGQRMLGLAYSKTDSGRTEIDKESCEKQKIFLGVVGIIDPPRDEVIEAIKECKAAGVTVKMITGDHAITAKAIGKEIGIGDGEKVMTGRELEEMSDEKMREVVEEYDVYARTSPEHKLRLVTALQENGKLAAMTGDGVNDAPALKKANIGIAMGIKGTEVTKDASEMVLADDNFATIVNAIEEGRTVYDNIRKALLFILPTNGAEALVLMAAILLGLALPITPAQILWVNMVTAVTLALALSFEPMEEKVMERPPRKSGAPILGKLFVWRIAFVSFLIGGLTLAMFKIMISNDLEENAARTIAVNTLVAGQLFYLFNCRKIKQPSLGKGFFNNKIAFIAAGALILLQMIFVYVPFMNTFFDTAPISGRYWIYPLAAGLAVFVIVELEKFIINKFSKVN